MNTTTKPNRQDYLDDKISHQDYYLAVAEFIGATFADVPFGLHRIKESKDPHLNDLPLRVWDNQDPFIRAKAFKAGYKGWSLSDTVCVLKTLARQEASK